MTGVQTCARPIAGIHANHVQSQAFVVVHHILELILAKQSDVYKRQLVDSSSLKLKLFLVKKRFSVTLSLIIPLLFLLLQIIY